MSAARRVQAPAGRPRAAAASARPSRFPQFPHQQYVYEEAR
ncbi:hypothetical protein ACGFS9_16040 [Streptomyces sp. NPDC048566]